MCEHHEPVYLADIWSFLNQELFLNQEDARRIHDVLTGYEFASEWVEEICMLNDTTLLARNYDGIHVYQLHACGVWRPMPGGIPAVEGSDYANMRIQQTKEQNYLVLVDRKKNRIGWYSSQALCSGQELPPPLYQVQGNATDLVDYDRPQYTLHFLQEAPLLLIHTGGLAHHKEHALIPYHFREGTFLQKGEAFPTETLYWTEAIRMQGEERVIAGLFSFNEQSATPYLSSFRLHPCGQLEELDRIRIEVPAFYRAWKLIPLQEKLSLMISADGTLFPFRIDEDGHFHPLASIPLPVNGAPKGSPDYYRITDAWEDRLLCTNSGGRRVVLLHLHSATGEVQEQQSTIVDAPKYCNPLNALFVRCLDGIRILYHAYINPYGYLNVHNGTLCHVAAPDYQEKIALMNRFLQAKKSPVFADYSEEALDEVTSRILHGNGQRLEQAVRCFEWLAHSDLTRDFGRHLRQWINHLLPSLREHWKTYALDFLFGAVLLSDQKPERGSHLEWSSFGHYALGEDEKLRACYALLDGIALEQIMPQFADRMKFYKVLNGVLDECAPMETSTLERLTRKWQLLLTQKRFQQVVALLFSAIPGSRFEYSMDRMSTYLTAHEMPYLHFLLHDEVELPYEEVDNEES
jgi:hypothetical protein